MMYNKSQKVYQQKLSNIFKLLEPPPRKTCFEWAEQHLYLSSEASSEVGRYSSDRAPFQKEWLEVVSDPSYEMVVFMTASQLGKTTLMLGAIGYWIDYSPAPILYLLPNLEMARSFSTDRLSPLLRDCPQLKNKVASPSSKDGQSTMLHRSFYGGGITFVGGNSPAGLSGRPIRYLIVDEASRLPVSAGVEGNPFRLALARTSNFWNRKIVVAGTPTFKGDLIETLFLQGDQRHFHVPCPRCNHYQELVWGNVKFSRNEDKTLIPGSVYYECENKECGYHMTEPDKFRMLPKGRWIAQQHSTRIASFFLPQLYSPWVSWEQMAENFLTAKEDTESLRVFINTGLAQSWDPSEVTQINEDKLISHVEDYQDVPRGVCVLTAGVDVQDSFLATTVYGWGVGEESWLVDYFQIVGSPANSDTWEKLYQKLQKEYKNEDGIALRIVSTSVDSGGHFTQQVYDFCKRNELNRIYCIKGFAGSGSPIVSKFSIRGRAKVKLYNVGVDTAKEVIYSRLQKEEIGPGYYHFSRDLCDSEFFRQLTAEKQIKKYINGFPKLTWTKIRARNEVLDCSVYALSALRILNPDFEALRQRFIISTDEPNKEPTQKVQQRRIPIPRMGRSWTTAY